MSFSHTSPVFSDFEDFNETQSDINRKKRKAIKVDRKNKSHITFFFRIDENDADIAYCKICENNHIGTHKKITPYSRKGGNTSNMISHLRDKHKIIKENYTQYLDEYEEV